MNKRRLIITGAASLTLAFALFTGCDKKIGKPPVSTPPPAGACDSITYTKHIKKIMDENCVACHGDVNPVGGFSLNSYTQVKTYADNGKIKATVFDAIPKLMPDGGPPLPQAQKDLIMCWLNNGKKQ